MKRIDFTGNVEDRDHLAIRPMFFFHCGAGALCTLERSAPSLGRPLQPPCAVDFPSPSAFTAMQTSLLIAALLPVAAVFAQKPCTALTKCAVDKCLDKNMLNRVVKNSTRENVFGSIVEKFDLVCIASKCNKECQGCTACHYALEQMSALAQGEQTSGLCPKLESCVFKCLVGELPQIIACVASKCNVHCYDGDCPSCKTMSKRMFSLICSETGMLNQLHYPGTCPNLFNDLSDNYVAKRKTALNLQ